MSKSRSYYELLELSPGPDITVKHVKEAYRQALLKYHPDKIQAVVSSASRKNENSDAPTVDQIVEAYNTLLDPNLRKAYDTSLKSSTRTTVHQGIETFDLEDLEYHEQSDGDKWTKSCRCGSPVAYVLTEQDLEQADMEQASAHDRLKEILVGCRGCSLFIRVTFTTSEE